MKSEEINTGIYENPQKEQIIEMLKSGGIVNVSLDTADELMRGVGVSSDDQLAIAGLLEKWQKSDEISRQAIADDLVNIVKKGGYLRLED